MVICFKIEHTLPLMVYNNWQYDILSCAPHGYSSQAVRHRDKLNEGILDHKTSNISHLFKALGGGHWEYEQQVNSLNEKYLGKIFFVVVLFCRHLLLYFQKNLCVSHTLFYRKDPKIYMYILCLHSVKTWNIDHTSEHNFKL